jgi:regulator of RNase E activity RraB
MSNKYPNDADGDALRRVASMGADLSRPMDIDFFVAVPDRQVGEQVARLAALRGYQTKVIEDGHEEGDDEQGDTWTCYCTKAMLATYDNVVEAQRELDELSRAFGGHSDGWGTFGNSAEV